MDLIQKISGYFIQRPNPISPGMLPADQKVQGIFSAFISQKMSSSSKAFAFAGLLILTVGLAVYMLWNKTKSNTTQAPKPRRSISQPQKPFTFRTHDEKLMSVLKEISILRPAPVLRPISILKSISILRPAFVLKPNSLKPISILRPGDLGEGSEKAAVDHSFKEDLLQIVKDENGGGAELKSEVAAKLIERIQILKAKNPDLTAVLNMLEEGNKALQCIANCEVGRKLLTPRNLLIGFLKIEIPPNVQPRMESPDANQSGVTNLPRDTIEDMLFQVQPEYLTTLLQQLYRSDLSYFQNKLFRENAKHVERVLLAIVVELSQRPS